MKWVRIKESEKYGFGRNVISVRITNYVKQHGELPKWAKRVSSKEAYFDLDHFDKLDDQYRRIKKAAQDDYYALCEKYSTPQISEKLREIIGGKKVNRNQYLYSTLQLYTDAVGITKIPRVLVQMYVGLQRVKRRDRRGEYENTGKKVQA